jgi:hypothetical protein
VAGLRGISGAILDVERCHASPLALATNTDVASMNKISHEWCYLMAAAENDEPGFFVRQYSPPPFVTAQCGLREQISREGSPRPTCSIPLLAYLQTG